MSDTEVRRGGTAPALQIRPARDLPHNIEAEQAVLGALLIEETAFDLVADRVKAEDFYLHAHQLVYAACAELAQEKQVIDPVLLHQRLEAKGLLGAQVPRDLPFGLAKGFGTAANVGHYAAVVSELAQERQVIDPVLLHQRLEAKGLLGAAVPRDLPFGLAKGLGTREAARRIASQRGLPRREIYQRLLERKGER